MKRFVLLRDGRKGQFPLLQLFINWRRWTFGIDGSSGTLHLCLPVVQLTVWFPVD